MSDMNFRALLGRGREWLGRIRIGRPADSPPGSVGLLALRLERDLPRSGKGRSTLIAATDDDVVGAETAVELAWSLAEELGHSVLLVDGTFEVAALSTALGLAARQGVAELLDAGTPNHAALQSLVQPTMHERISVLPRGIDNTNRATRWDAVRHLVTLASEHYEFVLVQGSIQAEGSPSLLFSSVVNAALLVAVEEKTLVDQITRGQRLLNDCGASRVALVLTNRPEPLSPKAP